MSKKTRKINKLQEKEIKKMKREFKKREKGSRRKSRNRGLMNPPQICPQTHPKIHEQVPVPADGAGVPHGLPPALRARGWGQSQSLPVWPSASQ